MKDNLNLDIWNAIQEKREREEREKEERFEERLDKVNRIIDRCFAPIMIILVIAVIIRMFY